MSFVSCTKCDWCQDDFWSENYNPIKSQMEYLSGLIEKAIDKENPQREITANKFISRPVIIIF